MATQTIGSPTTDAASALARRRRIAGRLAAALVVWLAFFLVVDVWLLGTRLDHYVTTRNVATATAVVALNAVLFGSLALFLTMVTRRIVASLCFVGAAYALLGFATRLKIANLGEPVLPWDYLSIRQFARMSTGYVALDTASLAALLVAAAGAIAGIVLWRREAPMRRGIALVALALISIPLYVIYGVIDPLRKPLGMLNITWAQAINLRSHGVLNHFALNLRPALVFPPAGYGEDAVRAACHSGPDETAADRAPRRHPHVVVVLSEAFTRVDRTLAPHVRFSSELAPFFSSLGPVAFSVPVFGGLTANTEFEILTGMPMAFLPTGAVPFQQYLRAPLPNALPRLFKQSGYRVLALHPFHRSFWNRDEAFRLLGFDRFIAIDDLGLPQGPPYVHDEALLGPIIDLVENSAQPLFLLVTTMENHGPWFADRYASRDVSVSEMPQGWTAQARHALANHAQGVRNGDRFLQALASRFAGRDDVLIAMFGDHHPTIVVPDMGNRNLMEIAFGPLSRKLPPDFDDRAILQTEIAFWPGSVDFKAGAQATQLGPALARRAGVPLDGFWKAVETFGKRYPSVQRQFAVRGDGTAVRHVDSDDARPIRVLQYDALFGARHAARVCGMQP